MTITAQVTQDADFETPQGCRKPRQLTSGGKTFLAGCGQCRVCRRKRRQHWVGRCELELRHKKVGSFLTLTYDPQETDECSYEDVKIFNKRIRKWNSTWDYSMIARGELGDRFGRFHWHLLAFGMRDVYPDKSQIYMPEWDWGHVFVRPLNAAAAAYTYAYTEKDNSWGETRYSSRPCIGYVGMMDMADEISRFQKYAIAPGHFSVGGVRYPVSYFMKHKMEDRMVENGLIEVPGLSPDQLLDRCIEYESAVAQGRYARPHAWHEAERRAQAPKERKLDGHTQKRLQSLLPTRSAHPTGSPDPQKSKGFNT